uniref:Uncharacterized protein n=1 Tax=Fagus sylvatica TaxID=28930 RepID=A0A2N9FX95_FAGSY
MGWQKRLEHWRRCGPMVAWSGGSLLFCLLDSGWRFGAAMRLALICLDGSCSFDGCQEARCEMYQEHTKESLLEKPRASLSRRKKSEKNLSLSGRTISVVRYHAPISFFSVQIIPLYRWFFSGSVWARSCTRRDLQQPRMFGRFIKDTPFKEPLRNRMASVAMVNPFRHSYCLLGLDIS